MRVSSPVRQAIGWVLPVDKLQKRPSSSDHQKPVLPANQIECEPHPLHPNGSENKSSTCILLDPDMQYPTVV